jgi:hypothetical protein
MLSLSVQTIVIFRPFISPSRNISIFRKFTPKKNARAIPPDQNIYNHFHLPSLILTQSANCGKVPLKLGPSVQFPKSLRWLSNTGLISHWSSSFGRGPRGGCGVAGSCGEPACTWVEGAEKDEEVTERVEVLTFDAGSRTSWGS